MAAGFRHRISIFKPLVFGFGIRSPNKSSVNDAGESIDQLPVKLENTYKMEPDERFQTRQVKDIVLETLRERLETETYNFIQSPRLAKELSSIIKDKVKKLGYKRHKIVVQVIITPKSDQGLQVGSRCAWNDKHDNYSAVSYKNSSMCAVALVYGVYYE